MVLIQPIIAIRMQSEIIASAHDIVRGAITVLHIGDGSSSMKVSSGDITAELPYRFRDIILQFSRIGLRPRKLSPRNVVVYKPSLVPRNVQYDQTAKIMCLKNLALHVYGIYIIVNNPLGEFTSNILDSSRWEKPSGFTLVCFLELSSSISYKSKAPLQLQQLLCSNCPNWHVLTTTNWKLEHAFEHFLRCL